MMLSARLRLAAMILCALALTGCGQDRPRIVLPPLELTTCADEPQAPELPLQTPDTQHLRDEMMLDFVLALRSAWGDCKSKVDGLKAWRETISPAG